MMEKFENNDIADQVVKTEQIADVEATINKQEAQEEKLAISNSLAELNTLKATIKDSEKIPNLEAKIEAVSNNHENSTTPVALQNNKQSDIGSRIAAQNSESSYEANQGRESSYNQVSSFVSTLPTGLARFFADA